MSTGGSSSGAGAGGPSANDGGGAGGSGSSTTTGAPPASGSLVGKIVKIVNTVRYADECGRCTAYNTDRQRYTIEIDAATIVSIRAQSTIAATTMESLKFQWKESQEKMKQMLNDPIMQQQVMQVYQQCKQILPPWLPPERLVIGWLVMTILCLRFIGFSKTLLLGSTLSLPIVISLPDAVNNGVRDPKILVQNFPRNIKLSIVTATGGKFGTANMDERFALGGFVLVVAMTVKMLLTPAVSTAAAAATGGGLNLDVGSNSSGVISRELFTASEETIKAIETSLKNMYHLGFDDATDGNVSGESMTENLLKDTLQTITTTMSTSIVSNPPMKPGGASGTSTSDDFDYNTYMPTSSSLPPKKTFMQKLNFYTMMAGVNLVQTCLQLGRNPNGGGFDPQLLIANIKLLPPWRIFLLGLSAYRVASMLL